MLLGLKSFPIEREEYVTILSRAGMVLHEDMSVTPDEPGEDVERLIGHILGDGNGRDAPFRDYRRRGDVYEFRIDDNRTGRLRYVPHRRNRRAEEGEILFDDPEAIRLVIKSYVAPEPADSESRDSSRHLLADLAEYFSPGIRASLTRNTAPD